MEKTADATDTRTTHHALTRRFRSSSPVPHATLAKEKDLEFQKNPTVRPSLSPSPILPLMLICCGQWAEKMIVRLFSVPKERSARRLKRVILVVLVFVGQEAPD
eukprot:scaffold7653_cov120-Isochrysis_galbana.AAC.3